MAIPETSGEELRLWQTRDRDPRSRERLIEMYMPLARSLAKRYRGASEPMDDLVQVANLGLINAIDRYDPSRGTPFVGFASPTILGELKRHFRDRAWTVRVPRALHDRMAEVERAVTAQTSRLQRSPTVSEIASETGLEELEVLEVLEAGRNRRALSIDRPAEGEEEDETAPGDWLGAIDENFELIENRAALSDVLPTLEERERHVLKLRFVDELTQSEIAERIGFSQMHVSRILRRTLERIRNRAEESEAGE